MEYVNERVNKIVGHAGWLVMAVLVSKDINANFQQWNLGYT